MSSPKHSTAALQYASEFGRPMQGWRLRCYTIIFETDIRAGRLFELSMIALVLLSLLTVMLDRVVSMHAEHGQWLSALEIFFTGLLTIEYLLRVACVCQPLRYTLSFYGIVDLLSVLPTYLASFVPKLAALIDVRVLRLLRVFRILKLNAYVAEYASLAKALRASSREVAVFISAVLMIVLGTVMYVVKGPAMASPASRRPSTGSSPP